MAVVELKSAGEFEEAVQKADSDKLVVVDFYATWCGPCKMIGPMVEKFSAEYSQANFYKIDVDAVPEIAQKYGVTAMPTIVYLKNGQEITKVIGANPAAIKQTVAANI